MKISNAIWLFFGTIFFASLGTGKYKKYFEKQELKGDRIRVELLSYNRGSKTKNSICVNFNNEKKCLIVRDSYLYGIEKKDSVDLYYDSEKDILFDSNKPYKADLYAAYFMLSIAFVILFFVIRSLVIFFSTGFSEP